MDKGIECITDKVSVHGDYVVMVPSWPLEAQAIVMTLDIHNKMAECGKYLFTDPAVRAALDDNWEHTQLRVVRCQVGDKGKIFLLSTIIYCWSGRGGVPRPGLARADHGAAVLHAAAPAGAGPGGAAVRVPADQVIQVHCSHPLHREEVRHGESMFLVELQTIHRFSSDRLQL